MIETGTRGAASAAGPRGERGGRTGSPLRWGSAGGQQEADDGAAVGAVGGLGVAAVALRDRLDDRQTQPGPAVLAGPGAVGAVEALEGVRQEFRREPRGAVADADLQRPVQPAGAEPDCAAIRGDAQGVVDQVVDGLAQPVVVDGR